MESPAVLQIDVVSDVVCPWCYVGKRQLEQAMELWQRDNPALPPPSLRGIASDAGLADGLIDAVLQEDAVTRIVAAADAELREYGVTGVPLFIIGGETGERLAVSGAQGAKALLQAMRQAQSG